MTDEGQSRRVTGTTAGLFALLAVLAGADLVADMLEGTTLFHVLIEGGVVLIGLAGTVLMGRQFMAMTQRERELEGEATLLSGRLEASRANADRWREEAAGLLRGLSDSIDEQLTRWELTPAEKEVALLLLKGLSLKEVAELREVSAATARQQARAVYRKADLSGRSELAAFFLEDLLVPRTATSP